MKVSLTRESVAERRVRVARLTADGLSSASIGVVLGLSERSVVRIRSELGIAKVTAPPLDERELACAADMLADGCSYAEVARTLGRGTHAIAEHFPGYAWSRSEIGQFALMSRRAAERMRAVYA